MKPVIFTSIITIILVFFLPAILSFGIRFIPQADQPSLDLTQKIFNDVGISQLFISTTNNLSSIGLSIKNPNLSNKKDIILSIYDEQGTLLRTISHNGKSIADGKFVKFTFESIKNSKDKKLLFTLLAPTVSREEADQSKSLEVFLTHQRKDNVFELIIADQIILNTWTSFVAFYQAPYPTYLLENIYSKWFKNLASDWTFFIAYLLLIASLTSYLIYHSIRLKY